MEENKTELIPVGNGLRVLVFMGMGLLSVITGIVRTPSFDAIREGLVLQQTATGLLDMNSFLVVGEHIGVPYINAGLLLIFVMVSYLFTKTPVNGGAIAAAFMVYGFGFCGKTLWNVWPLFAGVMVHARRNKKSFGSATPLAWFSAALSPMVSIMTFHILPDGSSNDMIGEAGRFSSAGLVCGIVFGLMAGYLLAVFASFLPEKHNGLTLYNGGFAAGLTGFLFFAVMKVIGLGHTGSGPFHEYEGFNDTLLLVCIGILLAYLLLCGLLIAQKERGRLDEIVAGKYTGSAIEQFGFGATLVNMAVCGVLCLLYWVLTTTASAHAPLYASLFTVVGFAANGISIRTMLPVFAGVYCASFGLSGIRAFLAGEPVLKSAIAYVGSKNMLIAAFFGCGMAPVAYKHGPLIAFCAAMVHSVLVLNTAVLHGWMNLYNNGFCLGLVVTFVVPAILNLLGRDKQKPA